MDEFSVHIREITNTEVWGKSRCLFLPSQPDVEIRGSLTERVKDWKAEIRGSGECKYKRKRESKKQRTKEWKKRLREHVRSSDFVSRVSVCRKRHLHPAHSYTLNSDFLSCLHKLYKSFWHIVGQDQIKPSLILLFWTCLVWEESAWNIYTLSNILINI